jgi:hypothetical protein
VVSYKGAKQAPCSLGLSATSQQYFSLTTNQQPASSTILSEQISISHQPTEQAVVVMKLLKHMILLLAVELILS